MIRFERLSKSFGDKEAVKDLDLVVPRGSMFGFLGPNGAGKTTTLRMLMGFLKPTSGKAFVNDLDVVGDPIAVRAEVGYLPDEVFLYDYLTGQQYLEFVADVRGLGKAEREERIDYYLDFFHLDKAAGDYTTNYSFGMKKKLALAAIVLHKPSVLVLDEPFNGLDPQAVKDFRELLRRMVEGGATVILSSHVLEVVEKLVSHIGIINEGRLQAAGPMEELKKQHGDSLEQTFFDLTSEGGDSGPGTQPPAQ